MAAECYRFSREIAADESVPFNVALKESVRGNLKTIRTVFAKWSLEILVLIYLNEAIGFTDLKRSLGSISSRVLSLKLRRMERAGLVHREMAARRPPRTWYSLTSKGLTVSRLGEPVLLYLRSIPCSGD